MRIGDNVQVSGIVSEVFDDGDLEIQITNSNDGVTEWVIVNEKDIRASN